MEVTALALRLVLLFLPGIVCSYTVDALTMHRRRTPFFFLLQSLIYGSGSYLIYWAAVKLLSPVFGWLAGIEVVFLRALVDPNVAISIREVFFASATGVLLGLCLTVIATYKLHTRLVKFLRITDRFGELDVWGFTFNTPGGKWVVVRDHEHDLAYDGWVKAFSDDAKEAELLLRDVRVLRNSTAKELYTVDAIYLSLDRSNLVIEIEPRQTDKDVQAEGGTNA